MKAVLQEIHIHTAFEMWAIGKILPITPGNMTFKFLPGLQVRIKDYKLIDLGSIFKKIPDHLGLF